MKAMTAGQIAAAVEGLLQADANISVSCVSTDTRAIEAGSLFVAIRGPRFDGHAFAAEAVARGAALVLADEQAELPEGLPVIRCKDTTRGLGALAAWHRSRFDIPVVAITGSVGKTSTKEMIAAALGCRFHVLKTKGNFNNDIGLPLSVLALDDSHTAAVFELGMSGLGEISRLSRIVCPDVAVITNIGLSHIEKLGSRRNILRAKLEITEGMSPDGIVVLNGDDELLKGLRGLLPIKTLYYGFDEATDVQGYDAFSMGEHGMTFKAGVAGQEGIFTIHSPGMHSVSNALAALAVCQVLDISMAEAQSGLVLYTGSGLRMDIRSKGSGKIINDTYNAAPSSMKAALNVLAEIGAGKRTVAVLGDMLELGDWSMDTHLDVGRHAANMKVDMVVGIGKCAKWYLEGAFEMGMKPERMMLFADVEEAYDSLAHELADGDVILFKASRGVRLDSLVKRLYPDSDPVA